MNTLPLNKKVAVVASLSEGNSIRSTERLTGTHRDTVMRLGRDVGEGCARLHDRIFRNLNVALLEVDELWSFVGKKQGHLTPDDDPTFGDSYTFTGIDATHKTIVSFLVGRRDGESTNAFCADLRARILNRPQVSSDGFDPYREGFELAFGAEVDYAMCVKEYGGAAPAMPLARRYSPPRVTSMEVIKVSGDPDPSKIGTSHMERGNLSIRMMNRRHTRLTNAYSKVWRNHAASVALTVCAYNLCRVHSSLRLTPAMALGVTDHVWTIGELVAAALAEPIDPKGSAPTPSPASPPSTPAPSSSLPEHSKWHGVDADRVPVGGVGTGRTVRPTFTVIDGGKK